MTMNNTVLLSTESVSSIIGDPALIAQSLKDFRKSASVLSGDSPRMIESYPNQWVALFNGEVAAHATTFDELMAAVDRDHLPKKDLLVRLIETKQRVMIL